MACRDPKPPINVGRTLDGTYVQPEESDRLSPGGREGQTET
jgi:hypothetical protein